MAKKVIVAVHGIGEQGVCETIQSVAYRFCTYFEVPAAIPIGRLHSMFVQLPKDLNKQDPLIDVQGEIRGAFIASDGHPDLPADLGFAEVYWANFPRGVAKEGFTLEETKKWARTIVERLRMKWQNEWKVKHPDKEKWTKKEKKEYRNKKKEFYTTELVLEEMIDTIGILERLTFIAAKAGVFKFDLKPILIDFIGDVQVVTEFEAYRKQIINRFDRVMKAIASKEENKEIYIVAHSEGTVIAFLGLMKALCEYGNQRKKAEQEEGRIPRENGNSDDAPHWITKVRGIMTIGSPIDVHMTLWRDLWANYEIAESNECARHIINPKIQWKNYFDNGDPIGFSLDVTKKWLNDNKWDVFEIEDIRFSRYEFPGKAHVDYWTDEQVFGHFLENVVKVEMEDPQAPVEKLDSAKGESPEAETQPKKLQAPVEKPGRYKDLPPTRILAQIVSYGLPYLLVFGTIFAAMFILHKSVKEATSEASTVTQQQGAAAAPAQTGQRKRDVFRDVSGLALLLFGITVVVRIPRLTRMWRWRIISGGVFGIAALAYPFLVTTGTRTFIRGPLERLDILIQFIIQFIFPDPPPLFKTVLEDISIIVMAVVIVGFASWASRERPQWGLKPLLWIGGGAIFGLIIYQVATSEERGSIWPLVVGGIVFLYLWWLAALIFDLTFTWHKYIRHAEGRERLDEYKNRINQDIRRVPQTAAT